MLTRFEIDNLELTHDVVLSKISSKDRFQDFGSFEHIRLDNNVISVIQPLSNVIFRIHGALKEK